MPTKQTESEVYVANQTGFVHVGDEDLFIKRSVTRVRKGHPLLKAAPALFDPIEKHLDFDVEQATAAPGEKRA